MAKSNARHLCEQSGWLVSSLSSPLRAKPLVTTAMVFVIFCVAAFFQADSA
ncbi:MAG: hypothetical protein JWP89_2016 [Schlesneria sp.]|nr:hypothetical protein [Schlesneria sp.]